MSLIIKTIVCGIFDTNTYVVFDEKSKQGFVVDPSDGYEAIKEYLTAQSIQLQAILVTHGHFDHIGSVAKLQRDGARVYMSREDESKIANQNNYLASMLDITTQQFCIDVYVEEGQQLSIAGNNLQVLATAGHSRGGVCYICDNVIYQGKHYDRAVFCGDTIFRASYGRTDFPDGDFATLKKSITKILNLQGDILLLTGHGESTTSSYERQSNPIFYD
ncbi:MAG: MBL fold metallo-hydrolase [Christensenellales bacterium]